jgi:hypothetical protein
VENYDHIKNLSDLRAYEIAFYHLTGEYSDTYRKILDETKQVINYQMKSLQWTAASFGVEVQLTMSTFLNLGSKVEHDRIFNSEGIKDITLEEIEGLINFLVEDKPRDIRLQLLKAQIEGLKILKKEADELRAKPNLTVIENGKLFLASNSFMSLKKNLIAFISSSQGSVETEKIRVINSPTSVEVIPILYY